MSQNDKSFRLTVLNSFSGVETKYGMGGWGGVLQLGGGDLKKIYCVSKYFTKKKWTVVTLLSI